MIEAQLAGKTAQAQVVVTLVDNAANVVYVSGDVKSPGRFPPHAGAAEPAGRGGHGRWTDAQRAGHAGEGHAERGTLR